MYDHSSGRSVFLKENDSWKYLSQQKLDFEGMDYFMAISWGEDGQKIVDVFGYSGLKEKWKSNPEVSGWVIRNGIISKTREITCGEGLIVLGQEERHRRQTRNLKQYLALPPDVRVINGIISGRFSKL